MSCGPVGVRGLRLLKTTKSGYEGFLHDRFTLLPDTRERILASSVTASWRCGQAGSGPPGVARLLIVVQAEQESSWRLGTGA